MGSLEHAPPFPCCGGLAFHAEWCGRRIAGAARYAWRTVEVIPDPATVAVGRAFRAIRIAYGLTLREVADGWSIPHVEMGDLERGKRRFTSPADLHAALCQLWLWAVAKNPAIER